MNVERLKHMAEYFRHLPDDSEIGFNMTEWFQEKHECHPGVEIKDYRGHPCGTAACYAGHTVHLFAGDASSTIDIEQSARKILDLTVEQAGFLFMPYNEHLNKITPLDAARATDRLLQGVALQDLWDKK